jgi:hypothetical protein
MTRLPFDNMNFPPFETILFFTKRQNMVCGIARFINGSPLSEIVLE